MKGRALSFRQTLGVIPVFLLLSSCAAQKMYTGADLPADKLARIEASSSVTFESCDGLKTNSSALIVEPGKHTIETSFFRTTGPWAVLEWTEESCFTSFTAKEGHVYLVDYTSRFSEMVTQFVIDRATGQSIASGCITHPTWWKSGCQ